MRIMDFEWRRLPVRGAQTGAPQPVCTLFEDRLAWCRTGRKEVKT
jgi:hypothetical protein